MWRGASSGYASLGEQKATYFLPNDDDYPGPNVFMKYVCSEQEAIDEGADWYLYRTP